jgi:hypothetical protein
MLGDGDSEQSSFALELTYNYGVNDYMRGNDLRFIAVSERSYVGPESLVQITPGKLVSAI